MRAVGQYFSNFFRLRLPQGKAQQQAYKEITKSLENIFDQERFKEYMESLPTRTLLHKSVDMFVGSRSIPKNQTLTRQLLALAAKKAQNEQQMREVQYYRYYFIRMNAFRSGNQQDFELTSEQLNKLAEENSHPQSSYLVGKQLFNLAEEESEPEAKAQILKTATYYFEQSLTEKQFGAFFYIGQILRRSKLKDIKQQQIHDIFLHGAGLGDPMCYFAMAQIYKKQGRKDLFMRYLKEAAQCGVLEAQHNLGCQYKDGIYVQKDELKAFAWFTQAAAHDFIYSKFNVIDMFLRGSSCGRIKKNKSAALLKLAELKESGQEVQDKIEELLKDEELRKLLEDPITEDSQ